MKYATLIISFALLLCSCTERIDLDLNTQEHQRLVVDAWVFDVPGESYVNLSLTTDYFVNEAALPATGATVRISDGTSTFAFTEGQSGKYFPAANFEGEAGKTYALTIDYEGERHEAQAELFPVTPIDTILLEYVPSDGEDSAYYGILLFAQEPQGPGDHYLWRVYKNGTLETDTLAEWVFSSDEFVDGNYIGGFAVNSTTAITGDVVTLEQMSISKASNDYFSAILLETFFRGGPFDSPPANVPTNLSNGALGFFNASARRTMSAIVP